LSAIDSAGLIVSFVLFLAMPKSTIDPRLATSLIY